jgi:ATP-dependent exoDNAse (exonuclease V) beta subunit
MQSIYRFRQAEVGLFLQLQREGLRNVQLEALRLSANFRSTRPIIDWVNRVFPAVLSAQDDPEQGAVKYSPSVAALGESIDGQAGAVHIHAALDEEPIAEARRVSAIVHDALARDERATIAVLVTARTHVGLIASELSAAGIEFQAIEIEPLGQRTVVQDLMALTRALVHPGDRTAWLAVLRAPWCGLELADLHALVDADRTHTINELLERAQRDDGASTPEGVAAADLTAQGRARLARVYPILRAALDERARGALRDWVERAWNSLGGPASLDRVQDLDDAQAFFERLDQIEVAGDLLDVARLEQQLERLFAKPRSESLARVEVMTIHKAKGLEFDTVILPGLHRWLRNEDHELLRWTRVPARMAGHGGIVFAPLKAQGSDSDPMYRWVELLERQRSHRERGRLLYVAATRAKRDLHLLGTVQMKGDPVSQGESGPRLVEPRHGSMLRMLWTQLRPQFEAAVQSPAPQQMQLASVSNGARLRRLPLAWQAPQADPSVPLPPMPVTDMDAAAPDFDWVTQTSRHVGTLVHRELERFVHAGLDDIEAPGQRYLAAISSAAPRLRAELAELGVPSDRCEQAVARVIRAVEQTLADERGRWLLGLGEQIQEAESELALSGALDGRLVSSVIDRSFVDARGVRWVVDFKTSTHEGGGLDEFLDAEVERYRGQLLRYARLMQRFRPQHPVRAALYFPLLRQWREVGL